MRSATCIPRKSYHVVRLGPSPTSLAVAALLAEALATVPMNLRAPAGRASFRRVSHEESHHLIPGAQRAEGTTGGDALVGSWIRVRSLHSIGVR